MLFGVRRQALVDWKHDVAVGPSLSHGGFELRTCVNIYCDETRHERHAISVTL